MHLKLTEDTQKKKKTALFKEKLERQLERKIKRLEKQMYKAAKNLDFIDAARVRDEINTIKQGIIKK